MTAGATITYRTAADAADALAARGHDRGAAYHKPILDAEA